MQTETQELEEHNRRTSRSQGYNLMSVRDSGGAKLSNGVVVRWHAPTEWHNLGGGMSMKMGTIPPGTFEIDGKLYDVEELRSYLRWA